MMMLSPYFYENGVDGDWDGLRSAILARHQQEDAKQKQAPRVAERPHLAGSSQPWLKMGSLYVLSRILRHMDVPDEHRHDLPWLGVNLQDRNRDHRLFSL